MIVTARRRAEDLQKVPVEVSVVTSQQIRALNVVNPQDVGNLVSGLQVDPGQSVTGATRDADFRYAIRGQEGGTGVVVYVNDVPNFLPNIFDLSNIQVLKGPQGTLFGNVTTGGAVLLQTTLPTDTFNGFVDVRYGSYNRADVEFGVGGPIIPGVLSVRLAGISHTSDGFTHNLFNGVRGDGSDNQALRFTAKLDVGRFEDVVLAQYSRNADQQRLAIPLEVNATDATGKTLLIAGTIPAVLAAQQGITCTTQCPTYLSIAQQQLAQQASLGHYAAYNNDAGQNAVRRQIGFINTASYNVTDWLKIRDIFGFSKTDITNPGDDEQDGFSLPLIDLYVPANKGQREYTNEFQILAQPSKSLHITLGSYIERDRQPTYQEQVVSEFGGILYGSNVGYITLASKTNTNNEGYYAQADWRIVPRLTVTGGVRYTHVANTNYSAPTIFSQCVGPAYLCNLITAGGITLSGNNTLSTQLLSLPGALPAQILTQTGYIPGVTPTGDSGHKITYTGAVNYEVTDNISTYFTTRTGYKPGGYNAETPSAQNQNFGPENVTDYEVGIKTRWSSNGFSGTANLAVYHDTYSNIQREAQYQDPTTGLPYQATSNIAAAVIKGFDFDTAVRYGAFDLTAYWSYTDAKYTRFPNSGQFGTKPPYSTVDLTQLLLTDVSKNRVGVRPSIRLKALGLGEDVTLSANVYYRSRFTAEAVSGILGPLSILPGRTIGDVRVDWNKVLGTSLGVAAGVLNVGNYQGLIEVNDEVVHFGYADGEYQAPRTAYVQFHWSF